MPEGPEVKKRLFTLEDATRMLPLVRAIVGDIVKGYKRLRVALEALEVTPGDTRMQEESELAREALRGVVDELQQLGLQLKDFEKGLVDFPHLREGKEVSLCWSHGEEKIGFWHDLDSGFSGRRPL